MKLPLHEFADIVAGLKGPDDAAQANAEKRQAPRMSITVRIDVHLIENGVLGRSFGVLVRDMSLTGIGALQSISLQSKREVLLSLPRRGVPLYAAAVVMHSRPLADGLVTVGYEFERILSEDIVKHLLSNDAAERARLARYILS